LNCQVEGIDFTHHHTLASARCEFCWL